MASSPVVRTSDFDAVIFDLDGVVTDTAKTHVRASKKTLEDYLKNHAEGGVEVSHTTLRLIRMLKSHGVKTAIVSLSKDCSAVLQAVGIAELFDVKVDGKDADEMVLEGKPSPDIFLEAARRLGVPLERAVVVKAALAGVNSGKRGAFGFVIGVDRAGHADSLQNHEADVVVQDLGIIEVQAPSSSVSRTDALPSALNCAEEIFQQAGGKRLVVFLDYDGTLTPIVDRPEQATLSPETKAILDCLSRHCLVAVISGRDLTDVRERVGIDTVLYAGSHGFDIAGPEGRHLENQQGADFLPLLDHAEDMLRNLLKGVPGAQVERKKFGVATHYRNVAADDVDRVKAAVEKVHEDHGELRKSHGKKVVELQPGIDWDKGKAVLWLLDVLKLDGGRAFPLYIGDDVTDEDAFRALENLGVGIVVETCSRDTRARYRLANAKEVQEFLEGLISHLRSKEGR